MLRRDWAPMNRLHCLPLALVSRMPPSALPQLPQCPCNCCQYGPAPLQVRQEARAAEMHSNRFSFLFSHKQQPLYTPSVCVSAHVYVCVPACVSVAIRDLHAVCPALFVPALSQTVNLRLWDKDRCHNQHLYKKTPKVNSHMCQSADWFTVESTEVGAGSITVISRAVGSSLMRFHAMTETAEGQCYAALQQGVPQQPVVPLLSYLPPHKAGRW